MLSCRSSPHCPSTYTLSRYVPGTTPEIVAEPLLLMSAQYCIFCEEYWKFTFGSFSTAHAVRAVPVTPFTWIDTDPRAVDFTYPLAVSCASESYCEAYDAPA